MNNEIFNIQVSKIFLANLTSLTKVAIKVYLSLAFLQKKRGGYFEASHREIQANGFSDFTNDGSFHIFSDAGQYYKAFKQLESLELIKVHRSKTKKGGNNINRYNVY